MSAATVISINRSPGGIPKTPIVTGVITTAGLEGDGHDHAKHDTPLQAISIIDVEDLDDLKREGFDVYPGATGENVTVRDLDIDSFEIGDQVQFDGGVTLELTKRRKPCFVLDAIDPELKVAIKGRIGFLAKVLTPGTLETGERVTVTRVATT